MFLAAKALIAVRQDALDHWSAIYYLLGHAIELLLKSILISDGVDLRTIKYNVGHNLEEAATLVVSRKIDPASAVIGEHLHLIHWLNLHYQKKRFEYRTSGYVSLPLAEEFVPIVEILLLEAEKLALSVYPDR